MFGPPGRARGDVILCVQKEGGCKLILASQPKSILREELTPHEESNTDHGAVSTFCAGPEGDILGGCVRQDAGAVEEVVGGSVGVAAGSLSGFGEASTGRGRKERLPQRVLRTGFGDAPGDTSATHRADAPEEFSAPAGGALPASRRGSDDADPGSVLARHLDAAGGPGGGGADGGGGKCPDGVQADPQAGRFGEGFSPSATEG